MRQFILYKIRPFLNVNDKRAEEISNIDIIENEIISVAGGYLGGYVCSGDSIKWQNLQVIGQGKGYSLKVKDVFEKIVIFTAKLFKNKRIYNQNAS